MKVKSFQKINGIGTRWIFYEHVFLSNAERVVTLGFKYDLYISCQF